MIGVFVATAVPTLFVIGSQMRRSAARALATADAQGVPHSYVTSPDEAQALIERCGPPDRDVSSADNDPPPPIPFRMVDYQGSHLEFAFVPGAGAKLGDPPPYKWKLSGILDTITKQAITGDLAERRMSCLGPPGSLGGPPSTPQP